MSSKFILFGFVCLDTFVCLDYAWALETCNVKEKKLLGSSLIKIVTLEIETLQITQKLLIFAKVSIISEGKMERDRLKEYSGTNIFGIVHFCCFVTSQNQTLKLGTFKSLNCL